MEVVKLAGLLRFFWLLIVVTAIRTIDIKPCDADSDCDTGKCVKRHYSRECSNGELHQACDSDSFCKSGLCVYRKCLLKDTEPCQFSTDCASERCRGSPRMECISGLLNQSCDHTNDCEGFSIFNVYRCDLELKKCKERVDTGGLCLIDTDCQSRRCAASICKNKLEDLEPCSRNADCKSYRCTGRIGALECSSRKIGHACASSDECNKGACLNQRCKLLEDGRPCSRNSNCQSRRCSGTWKQKECSRGLIGQTCDRDWNCISGRCEDNFCEPRLKDTRYCRRWLDCTSRKCLGKPGNKTCSSGRLGHSCESDYDCKSYRCRDNVCLEVLSDGQSCKEHGDCINFCRGNQNSAECSNGLLNHMCTIDSHCESGRCTMGDRCAKKLNDGRHCSRNVDCISAKCLGESGSRECTSGLLGQICKYDFDCSNQNYNCIDNRCRAQQKDGKACVFDRHCIGRCHGKVCSSGLLGQNCGWDGDCKDRNCVGFRCAKPYGPGDGPCFLLVNTCTNSVCNLRTQRCTKGKVNEPCYYSRDCPGLVCNNGRCKKKQKNGGACNWNSVCKSGRCERGVCAPMRQQAKRCTEDHECPGRICRGEYGFKECSSRQTHQACDKPEDCLSFRRDLYRCQEKLLNGFGCSDPRECQSGICRGTQGNKVCELPKRQFTF